MCVLECYTSPLTTRRHISLSITRLLSRHYYSTPLLKHKLQIKGSGGNKPRCTVLFVSLTFRNKPQEYIYILCLVNTNSKHKLTCARECSLAGLIK
jgi:hypothetical protein